MSARSTVTVITAVLAVLATACSSGGNAADPPPPSSESSVLPTASPRPPGPTTTATPSPSTSSTTSTPATTSAPVSVDSTQTPPPTPEPSTTAAPAGTDWVAVIQELENTRAALYEAPDPARTTEVCVPESECDAELLDQFGDMVGLGQRVVDSPPFEVVSAMVIPNTHDQPTPEQSIFVDVDVTFRTPLGAAGGIVDATGATVFELDYEPPPGETFRTIITLARGEPSQPWRESYQEIVE